MARPENPIEYTSTDEPYRGSRIRELRQKKGLSREEMAILLGCHPDSLSNVERNGVNPSQQMLAKAAKLLKVPLENFTQAPVHPRILRKKTAQPSTRLNSPVSTSHKKMLEQRLAVLEQILRNAHEQLREIRVYVKRM